MRRRILGGVAALAFVIAVAAGSARADEEKKDDRPAVGKLLEKKFEKGKVKYDYLLYLPADYGKDKAVPLVLFLHGKGDKLARMKRFGLPKQIERKKGVSFILVAPENPDQWWAPRSLNTLL